MKSESTAIVKQAEEGWIGSIEEPLGVTHRVEACPEYTISVPRHQEM